MNTDPWEDKQLIDEFIDSHKNLWFDYFVTQELIKKCADISELKPYKIAFCEKYESKFIQFADNYNQAKIDEEVDRKLDSLEERDWD